VIDCSGKFLISKDTVVTASHIRILKIWGIKEIVVYYMSIVLAHSAHAINSVEFFHVINLQNEMLEQLMAKRSQEAEGIEFNDQLDILRSMGCNTMQGFLYSRPVPADKASVFLKKKTLP